MVKWSVELSEFSIKFHPRKAIKAQELTNFNVELTFTLPMGTSAETMEKVPPMVDPPYAIDAPAEAEPYWSLYTDGATVKDTDGVGIFITSPLKEDFQYYVRFGFQVTKNLAEYKALAIGFHLAKKVGAKNLKLFVDSQLVAR